MKGHMKSERFFFGTAGAVFLALTLAGFHPFYIHATHADGSRINPGIFLLVALHGVSITAWFVLFFVQAVLISVRKRKLHMTLGWSAVAIGVAITCTGTLVAIRSVQLTPSFVFFGMEYPRFLLSMFTEIALFTAFITAGLVTRKRPKIHRVMMLMTSLTILPGATARIPMIHPIFGSTGWLGLFGPVFCLGAVLLLVRFAMTRTLDKWFAGSYAVWVFAYIASTYLALTQTWSRLAASVLAP
jgi:hypothetical protein